MGHKTYQRFRGRVSKYRKESRCEAQRVSPGVEGRGSLRASNAPANAWMFRNFDNTFVICPVTVARPLSCNMSQPGRGKQNLPTYSQKVPLSKITKTVLPFTKQIEHMCLAAPTENVLIPNFGPHVRHVRGIVGHDS